MRISDWSSDVCSSDLRRFGEDGAHMLRGDDDEQRAQPRQIVERSGRADRGRQRHARQEQRVLMALVDCGHHLGLACPEHDLALALRSAEHTSELQSLMRMTYAVFCLKKKSTNHTTSHTLTQRHI